MNVSEIAVPGGEETVQTVIGLHDITGKYSRHAGVAVTSLCEKASVPVCVNILHDNTLTDDNRSRFERTAEKFRQRVRFINVSEAMAKMGGNIDSVVGDFTRGAMFRLLIPDLLDVPKAIYLDCDIIVNLDIVELWRLGSEDFSVTVVLDDPNINRKWYRRVRTWAMGCCCQGYFCSGVIFMNLRRIRERYNLLESAEFFFERYKLCVDYPDQDFLNVMFQGDACYIDERFQRLTDHRDFENSILHLVGKPWAYSTGAPSDYMYWEIFARSEWRDQLADAVVGVIMNNPHQHRHTSDCRKKLLRNFREALTVRSFFYKLWKCAGIIAREARFRRAENRRKSASPNKSG